MNSVLIGACSGGDVPGRVRTEDGEINGGGANNSAGIHSKILEENEAIDGCLLLNDDLPVRSGYALFGNQTKQKEKKIVFVKR